MKPEGISHDQVIEFLGPTDGGRVLEWAYSAFGAEPTEGQVLLCAMAYTMRQARACTEELKRLKEKK